MKHPRISTYVLLSFAAMLALLIIVATTSMVKMSEIGRLAGELNGRMVEKTRIADEIVDIGQQIRFIDAFLIQSDDAQQDELVGHMIEARINALAAKTAAYMPYVDSDLDRSLLRNLDRSRSAYLALQAQILATPTQTRRAGAATNEDNLATAFDQANRMARGLAHVAESQARAARQQAADIVGQAQITVAVVSALAAAIGILISLLLRARIFKPLAAITRSLMALAQGRLEIALTPSGRGDEIDGMTQALDVFRNNALSLAKAHEETQAANRLADSLARHDAVTGLPNRRVLADTLQQSIARSERNGLQCGVLVLDLDRFKPINDIHGHIAGAENSNKIP